MKHSTFTKQVTKWVTQEFEMVNPIGVDQQNDHAARVESFPQWNKHWVSCLAKQPHNFNPSSVGCVEHPQWRENCPSCGEMPRWRQDQEAIKIFKPMAAELGHWWATEWTGVEPVNLTELVYLQQAIALFGDWGYNPPLTYEVKNSLNSPWAVQEIQHRTLRQRFSVMSDNVELFLTTTDADASEVAKANFYFASYTGELKVNIYPSYNTELQKQYRYSWLGRYIDLLQPTNVLIWDCGKVIAKDYWKWLKTIPD